MIIEVTLGIRLTENEYREVAAVLPRYHDEWRIEMPSKPEAVAATLEALHAAFKIAGMRPTFDRTPEAA